jgi:hypothetical protein
MSLFEIVTTPEVMGAWLKNIKLDPKKNYELVVSDIKRGTNRQNRTFHGLIQEYVAYSSHGDFDDTREFILMLYGPKKEIKHGENTYRIVPRWGKSSKDYRSRMINGLIAEMLAAGVNGQIFDSLVAEWKASVRGM